MTLDPFSLALGFVSAYVISTVMFIMLCVMDLREAKKQRDRTLDKLLTDVAISCLEHPTNVRTN